MDLSLTKLVAGFDFYQWAHFPHIHFGLMLETNNAKVNDVST